MTSPSADVSVRVAWSDDASGIADVQVRAWQASYAELLPEAALDRAQVAEVWHESLNRPQDARNRVLVALERNRICGFAVTSPAGDPDCDPVLDGELVELVVPPDERRHGHGSRLLQAAADTLVADRFNRAVTWVDAADDALRAFLTDAGWAADGAHRELDVRGDASATLKQVRLHTALA